MWAISIFSLAHSPGEKISFVTSFGALSQLPWLRSLSTSYKGRTRRRQIHCRLAFATKGLKCCFSFFASKRHLNFRQKSNLAENDTHLGHQLRQIVCRLTSESSPTWTTDLYRYVIISQLVSFQIFKRCVCMIKSSQIRWVYLISYFMT